MRVQAKGQTVHHHATSSSFARSARVCICICWCRLAGSANCVVAWRVQLDTEHASLQYTVDVHVTSTRRQWQRQTASSTFPRRRPQSCWLLVCTAICDSGACRCVHVARFCAGWLSRLRSPLLSVQTCGNETCSMERSQSHPGQARRNKHRRPECQSVGTEEGSPKRKRRQGEPRVSAAQSVAVQSSCLLWLP